MHWLHRPAMEILRERVSKQTTLRHVGQEPSPPPPSEFIAPHIPGAQKLQRPRIIALNQVDLYHLTPVICKLR